MSDRADKMRRRFEVARRAGTSPDEQIQLPGEPPPPGGGEPPRGNVEVELARVTGLVAELSAKFDGLNDVVGEKQNTTNAKLDAQVSKMSAAVFVAVAAALAITLGLLKLAESGLPPP